MSNFTLTKNMQYRTTTQKYMVTCTLPLTNSLNKAVNIYMATSSHKPNSSMSSAYK